MCRREGFAVRITIKDVARAASVSVATASMALNGKKGISDATRDRVMQVAKSLNYVPDYSARALVMGDSNCIGLMIPEIQNPFYCAIVDIVTRMAETKGYTLLLGITNNSTKQEREYIKLFLSRRVVGVIIVPVLSNAPTTSHLEMLRLSDVPMVFCTDRYEGCNEPAVMCDFELGEYEMTNYLIDKGLRNFCFLSTNIRANFSLLRQKGFDRALTEHDIPLNKDNVFLLDHPNYWAAYEITDRISSRNPEAIISINDIMTMAVVKRLMELGVDVPGDVSVAGFDDTMFSELVAKPLTTVRQPLESICQQSMDILEERISQGATRRNDQSGQVYYMKPSLVIRSTTI